MGDNAETSLKYTVSGDQIQKPIMPVWECRTYIDNIIGDRVFNVVQCSINNIEKKIKFTWIDRNNTPKMPLVILVK